MKNAEGEIEIIKLDAFVKTPKTPFSVIPVKTGIQEIQKLLDSRLRGSDDYGDFLREHQTSSFEIPWSPLAPPKAGKPCSTFDIQLVHRLRLFGSAQRPAI
jgi:hypothetical protein